MYRTLVILQRDLEVVILTTVQQLPSLTDIVYIRQRCFFQRIILDKNILRMQVKCPVFQRNSGQYFKNI